MIVTCMLHVFKSPECLGFFNCVPSISKKYKCRQRQIQVGSRLMSFDIPSILDHLDLVSNWHDLKLGFQFLCDSVSFQVCPKRRVLLVNNPEPVGFFTQAPFLGVLNYSFCLWPYEATKTTQLLNLSFASFSRLSKLNALFFSILFGFSNF